jgi:hypothetical protein
VLGLGIAAARRPLPSRPDPPGAPIAAQRAHIREPRGARRLCPRRGRRPG